MVVKMKVLHPPPVTGSKKFRVKVERIKLEGFQHDSGEKVMGVELRWKGERKHGLPMVRFHRKRPGDRWCKEMIVRKGEVIVWEEEDDLDNICWFSMATSDGDILGQQKFVPWIVTFKFTYGEYNKGRMSVIGKVSLNLAEFALNLESPIIEKKLPVDLEVAGFTTQATVSVLLSFVEIRDSDQLVQSEVSLSDSDNSVTFDSDESTSVSLQQPPVLEKKFVGLFDWKRRRLNRKPPKTKAQAPKFSSGERESMASSDLDYVPNTWETREIISRDGESKLNTRTFFASFDQCSDKAAGASACTALVTVIAHWLGSNNLTTIPTAQQFDSLIIDGSSEWRNLCEKGTYMAEFPDKHFDLETVLRAGIRPLWVSREKSFVGFFSPDKFESLTGVMSFEEIWDEEISRNKGVYIVSWNDHFFVLKGDEDGYYVIDTLGERLTEGCKQAYMLRFDDESFLRETETEQVVSSGKECCKEYIKRFLAAIPLKEMEKEEEEAGVGYYSLHQRLQIEFNLCRFN